MAEGLRGNREPASGLHPFVDMNCMNYWTPGCDVLQLALPGGFVFAKMAQYHALLDRKNACQCKTRNTTSNMSRAVC